MENERAKQLFKQHRMFRCVQIFLLNNTGRDDGRKNPPRSVTLNSRVANGDREKIIFRDDGVHIIYRQPPSAQSRVHQVARLRTNGVHCRRQDSAGTRPIVLVLKVLN